MEIFSSYSTLNNELTRTFSIRSSVLILFCPLQAGVVGFE